tara:strand:- start:358 stop:2112 length:1755 start_codon:yes stop_codon:yes gene_type:complete
MKFYQKCAEYWQNKYEIISRRFVIFSKSQALLFISLIISLAIYPNVWIFLALFLSWLVLTVIKAMIKRKLQKLQSIISVYRDDAARINVDWANIHSSNKGSYYTISTNHAFAHDLEIIGDYSLHTLLDRCETKQGSEYLLKHLLSCASNAKNKVQHDLIREVETYRRFRTRIRISGKKINNDISFSLNSSLLKPSFASLNMLYAVYILGWAMSIIGILWGTYMPSIFFIILYCLFFGFTFNLKTLRIVRELENTWRSFLSINKFCCREYDKASPTLKEHLNIICNSKTGIEQYKKQLTLLLLFSGLQSNLLLALFFNFLGPLNAWLETKVSILVNQIKEHSPKWIEAWAHLEAMSCLAHLSERTLFNHAQIIASPNLELVDFGHPLIPDNADVQNSINIGDTNNIVLITGANMSGKSTLLRAVSMNMVLALSGARVKAKFFTLPESNIITCISPRDSLTDGSSRFHAEVARIKKITNCWEDNNKFSIFFIDEIFSSTNNEERAIATLSFIKKSAQHRTIGFITTHDSNVLKGSLEMRHVSPYHMKSSIVENTLHFDYRLHEGGGLDRNALHILYEEGVIDNVNP